MHAYTQEPMDFSLLPPPPNSSFYGISDGYTLLSGVLHCVYFYKDSWELEFHLGYVRLSEIYSKIATL